MGIKTSAEFWEDNETVWNVFAVHSRHFPTNVWMRESMSDKWLNTFGGG